MASQMEKVSTLCAIHSRIATVLHFQTLQMSKLAEQAKLIDERDSAGERVAPQKKYRRLLRAVLFVVRAQKAVAKVRVVILILSVSLKTLSTSPLLFSTATVFRHSHHRTPLAARGSRRRRQRHSSVDVRRIDTIPWDCPRRSRCYCARCPSRRDRNR